jgi:hypothetical protein
LKQFRKDARESLLSTLDPDSHARLKARRQSLWIETQAKRVAVMIPDDPLRLPRGERSGRPQFRDKGFDRAAIAGPYHVRCFSNRETGEMVLALNESHCSPAALGDFSLQRVDLFAAGASTDVVPGCGC